MERQSARLKQVRVFSVQQNKVIRSSTRILKEGERLDQIAGVVYGDGTLWWVIAAASGIGWAMQLPPGTRLRIPDSPSEVFGLLL